MGWLRIILNCKLMSRCAVLRRRHPININTYARQGTNISHLCKKETHLQKCRLGRGYVRFPGGSTCTYNTYIMPHYATWKVDSWHSVPLNLVYDDAPFFQKKNYQTWERRPTFSLPPDLSVPPLHSGKLTQQWKMDTLKMYFLLKMGIFHYIAMLV